jgi:hypothetical protein
MPECLAQIEMSQVVPFRNVTHGWLQSGGGRARSPHTAQSLTAGRLAGRSGQDDILIDSLAEI